MQPQLEPDHLLVAYAGGIFPMADEEGEVHWVSPDPRAIIELNAFKVSRSLRAVIRRGLYTVTVNRAFPRVIRACAARDEGTWISRDIVEAYVRLHHEGFAHSVESWEGDKLAGGLYGVAIGSAFFGESMFFRATDASKVAMAHLVERMKERHYRLLDVQFLTPHLARLGAVEISRRQYLRRLRAAIQRPCAFDDTCAPTAVQLHPGAGSS